MSSSFFKISKGVTLTPQVAEPSGENGDIYYNSVFGRFRVFSGGAWKDLGAGSGSGGINYLADNPDAESSIAGWATYADAAAASPVDGTGGSPASTFVRSTSSPLRSQASFLWTKSAANRQGEGFSYDFTIDAADKAKVLQISFDYLVSSGTFASSDMTVWVYDVTNAALIQPAGYTILNSLVSTKQLATFQTASNSTSYRLIVHTASTSASAYTLQFDNFRVGPNVTNGVIPKSSTIQKFTSGSGTYTTPAGVYQIKVRMVGGGGGGSGSGLTGAAAGGTGGTTNFGAPMLSAIGGAGGTMGTGGVGGVGGGTVLNSPAIGTNLTGGSGMGSLYPFTGTSGFMGGGSGAASPFGGNGGGAFSTGGPATGGAASPNTGSGGGGASVATSAIGNYTGSGGGAGGYIEAWISNPASTYAYAVGAGGTAGPAGTNGAAGGAGGSGYIEVEEFYLGANVQLSSDTDTRVVAMRVQAATPTGPTNTASAVVYGATPVFDTHGGYNASTGQYTVSVSGFYSVFGSLSITGTEANNNFIDTYIYKSGTPQQLNRNRLQNSGTDDNTGIVNCIVQCVAGDTLEIRVNTNVGSAGFNTNANINFFQVSRLSGPSVIAASESVSARYIASAGQTIATGAGSVVDFATKDYDSHSAVTTGGSWKFTAPINGKYRVSSMVYYDSATWTQVDKNLALYKNGSLQYYAAVLTPVVVTTSTLCVQGSTSINLLAGDYIQIVAQHSEAASKSLSSNNQINWICIERIGN